MEANAIEGFSTSFQGKVFTPLHAAYENSRQVFNAMIDKRPALIAVCASAADVVSAVKFARQQRLLVAVRGCGHNIAGTCVCDGGMLIDLSQMKGIRVDAPARTVRVEPGVNWGELNDALDAYDLATTGGFISTTGVAGLTVGGGLGWLVRKHGLALDNLRSVEVVTAGGRLLTAGETENPDLFWGVRGGGGNFGIVTSFEFQAHPVGNVLAGLTVHPVAKARDALRLFREYEKTSPEELTNGALLFSFPDDPAFPEPLRGVCVVGLGGVYAGDLSAGEKALAPLRAYGPPMVDTFATIRYSAAQKMADFLWPRGILNYWKSGFLKDLSNEAIDVIVDFYARVPSKRTNVVLEHDGPGAMERVPDDATAFGHRNWPYNLLITSGWTDPAETERNIRWTREFFEAMRPFMADAVYVNYLGDEGAERVSAAYGKKYERLVALKNKYDPENFFRMNQNIKPTVELTTSASGD